MRRTVKTTAKDHADWENDSTADNGQDTLLAPTISNSDTSSATDSDYITPGTSKKTENTRKSFDSHGFTPEAAQGTVVFHNINYAIRIKEESNKGWYHYRSLPCFKPKVAKQILFDISGIFTTGLNAILGPTGCGKTSLLDILADRKDSHNISGSVHIDGLNYQSLSKYMVGYLPQENIYSGTLTVRENLFFSANLRLPKTLSEREIKNRVSAVISELALDHCADIQMGTELLRGVSGGEKKRTCIGMELILSPKVLFLDEPTTGLDASTAYNIVNCLKELSQRGRTIVFSIHQPRYSIFKLFDTAMFMCHGRSIFHGSIKDVIPHFAMHGYQCEIHDNPADFVLDVSIAASRGSEKLFKLIDAYTQSTLYIDTMASIEKHSTSKTNENLESVQNACKDKATQSIATEIFYISKRTIINALRFPELLFLQIASAIVTGLLVGLVFNSLPKTIFPGIQNRLGAISFIINSQTFSGISALEPFLKERVLFLHEYASGYYRVPSYFIAKVACDLLVMRVTSSVMFSIIVYPLTGLTRSTEQFFIFLFTVFMATVFGTTTSFLISTTVPVLVLAIVLGINTLTVAVIFGGFLVDLNSIFSWLSWMRWISAFRYATNVLMINEFKNLTFSLRNTSKMRTINGSVVLNHQHIDHDTPWDLWKYFLGLTLITVICAIIAFIQLLRTKKKKT